MAILIATASAVITGAATFAGVSTGTGAVAQTVTTKTSYTTTTYTYGTAFTGTNLDVVDGVLVHLRRNGTTGTVSIALSEDNGTTATKEVTVNASDLPANYAWVFIKFGTTLTLDGGTDYKVGFKVSVSGSGVTIGRDGTANNWAHILRKTTAATAAAGDVMYIAGEHTGAGATTTITVTMDQTAATDYGTGTDGAIDNGMEIGDAGVLTYSTTIAAYLKLSGSLNVWSNGVLNIGTVATPVARTSTAVLEFDPVADGGMGLIIQDGGTANLQGLSRTIAKDIFYCKLNTDEAIDSTSLGVDTDTGWLDNDEIAVFSTTRTGTQTEKGTLNGNAGASSLTVDGFAGVGGGLANAHSGTSPTQAEVILLTRNVEIRSATSTIMAYVYCSDAGTVDVDWVRFRYLGENATNKKGIELGTSGGAYTGSFSIQFCSLLDFEDGGFRINTASGNNAVFSSNVSFNLNTAAAFSAMQVAATTSAHTINSNILHLIASNAAACLNLQDVGCTVTNNVITYQGGNSTSMGILLSQSSFVIGTFSGNTVHSSSALGLSVNVGYGGTISTCKMWRNSGSGLDTANGVVAAQPTVFNDLVLTANVSPNWAIGAGQSFFSFYTAAINADASFATASGAILANSASAHRMLLINCTFGTLTAHTTTDLNIQGNSQVSLINCTLAAATEVTETLSGGYVSSHKNDGSSVTHKNYYNFGTIQSDQTIRNTASGFSWKMTPNLANLKLILPGPTVFDTFRAAVANGVAITVSAYVYKDATYNGNNPRLVVVGGIVAGVGSAGTDVTDTLSVAHSNWEQLTCVVTPSEDGVIEFYVDCDGTAGNVYVDDMGIA